MAGSTLLVGGGCALFQFDECCLKDTAASYRKSLERFSPGKRDFEEVEVDEEEVHFLVPAGTYVSLAIDLDHASGGRN